MRWIINQALFQNADASEFIDIANHHGHDVAVIGRVFSHTGELYMPFGKERIDNLALLVPIPAMLRYSNTCYGNGIFWGRKEFRQTNYGAYYRKYMLNCDQIFLPWSWVRDTKDVFKQRFNKHDCVFIRPDESTKTFVGETIFFDKWEESTSLIERFTSVCDNTLVAVASPKKIDGEWRFWINDGKIITSSPYSWDDIDETTLPAAPDNVRQLAYEIARDPWQPSDIFVCDICLSDGVAKLVEINSVTSSGLYAANLHNIIVHFEQYYRKTNGW